MHWVRYMWFAAQLTQGVRTALHHHPWLPSAPPPSTVGGSRAPWLGSVTKLLQSIPSGFEDLVLEGVARLAGLQPQARCMCCALLCCAAVRCKLPCVRCPGGLHKRVSDQPGFYITVYITAVCSAPVVPTLDSGMLHPSLFGLSAASA